MLRTESTSTPETPRSGSVTLPRPTLTLLPLQPAHGNTVRMIRCSAWPDRQLRESVILQFSRMDQYTWGYSAPTGKNYPMVIHKNGAGCKYLNIGVSPWVVSGDGTR